MPTIAGAATRADLTPALGGKTASAAASVAAPAIPLPRMSEDERYQWQLQYAARKARLLAAVPGRDALAETMRLNRYVGEPEAR